MPRVAALLAAGDGSRFHGPTHKLLAAWNGRSVWDRSLDHARSAGFDHVIVVTGAVALPVPEGVEHRPNPQWHLGQATSVIVAIEAAAALGADAVTIGLADQPFVSTSAWQQVADAPPDCRIVIAEYDGRPGPHPVRLGAEVWPLLPRDGDEGARSLLRLYPTWVCRIPCLGSGADIDTVEDLDRWKSC